MSGALKCAKQCSDLLEMQTNVQKPSVKEISHERQRTVLERLIMSSARSMIISLGHELSEQNNRAFDLWTWLPSYKAAQAAHGDYASEYTPSVGDVIAEAAMFISHGLNPNEQQREEAGDFYKCPCGECHD